jgi:hypothetical protein
MYATVELGNSLSHSDTSRKGNLIPREKDLEHEPEDHVCIRDKDGIKEWIIRWYQWALSESWERTVFRRRSDDRSAIEPDGSQEDNRCRENVKCCDAGVWFLAVPELSSTSGGRIRKYVNLPLGKWHYLAPVYDCHPSKEFYPSKNSIDLFDMAKTDVDSATVVHISLDGQELGGCRVSIKDPFRIKVDDSNIFGIRRGELDQQEFMNMVSDGYWVWLKELPVGDHILRTKAFSHVYELDTEYYLFVRGPGENCPESKDAEKGKTMRS